MLSLRGALAAFVELRPCSVAIVRLLSPLNTSQMLSLLPGAFPSYSEDFSCQCERFFFLALVIFRTSELALYRPSIWFVKWVVQKGNQDWIRGNEVFICNCQIIKAEFPPTLLYNGHSSNMLLWSPHKLAIFSLFQKRPTHMDPRCLVLPAF